MSWKPSRNLVVIWMRLLKAKLNRGRRTVEVLKQPVHEPFTVEKQVVILYALTHGFLDSVPVDDILRFEEELFNYL